MVEVKIKPGKYGSAIALLLKRGEGFQTRFEDLLIVTREQCRLLENAGFVEKNGREPKPRRHRGAKAK